MGGEMKKLIFSALLLLIFGGLICGETFYERVKLEKVFELRVGNFSPSILASIGAFDVDADGNFYIFDPHLKKLQVVDSKGKYLRTIGRAGQGPGEYQFLNEVRVMGSQVYAADSSQNKIIIYSKNGRFLKESRLKINFVDAYFLPDGKVVFEETEAAGEKLNFVFNLYSSDFRKIAKLDEIEMFSPLASKVKAIYYRVEVTASQDRIYTMNQIRGYEIWVYDMQGKLVGKIKKKYKPVSPDKEYREAFLEMLGKFRKAVERKLVFPEKLPPLHLIVTDERGRLWAMTYEKGGSAGEYLFDVFSPEGVFIARTAVRQDLNAKSPPRFKKGKIYCLLNEEDREVLAVYRVRWNLYK